MQTREQYMAAVLGGWQKPPAVTTVRWRWQYTGRFRVTRVREVFPQGTVHRVWFGWWMVTVMVPSEEQRSRDSGY